MSNRPRSGQARHAAQPSSKSDVFLVHVTNLPQGFDHNNLRAIAAQAAKFEKCFVCPHSCNGYVRVRGLDNASKLSNHLNHLHINNYPERAYDPRVPTLDVPMAAYPGYGNAADIAPFVPGNANVHGGYGGYSHTYYNYEYGEPGSSSGGGQPQEYERELAPVAPVDADGEGASRGGVGEPGSSSGGLPQDDEEWHRFLARLIADGTPVAYRKKKQEKQGHAASAS